jgi:Large polyvalent protein associated domain 29
MNDYSTTVRSIGVAETAKYIRVALKERFPGIKFSVRSKSYSGGASIRVEWFDGPTTDQVEDVTKRYEGASFDSMIDLKSYKDSELPDGERVHFGVDYVFSDRNLSAEFLTKVTSWYCKRYGYAMPVIAVSSYDFSARIDGDYYIPERNEWLGTLIYREHRQISATDVDDIDGMYARLDAEREAGYQAYLAAQAQKEVSA